MTHERPKSPEEAAAATQMELMHARMRKNWDKFAVEAEKFLDAYPTRRDLIEIDEEAWNGMKEVLYKYRQEKNWVDFRKLALRLQKFASDRVDELNIDDDARLNMREVEDAERLNKAWDAWATQALELVLEGLKRKPYTGMSSAEIAEAKKAASGRLREAIRNSFEEWVKGEQEARKDK